MKLIKSGLVAAVLALVAVAFTSSSALADPIGRAWTGSGSIFLDGGLGGSRCNIGVSGRTNGNSIDAVSFTNCSGAAGTPRPLVPWAVTWNGTNTGGTINVAALATIFGTSCLYQGAVNFTYAPRTITIVRTTIRKFSGPAFPCPATVDVTGAINWVS